MTNIIIGKRIPVGSFIGGIATILAFIFPDYAPAIIAGAVPLTAVIQVIIVNKYGVTK